jgi:hypothetical protein
MKTSHLYIDELGSSNPNSPRHRYFVMSACVISDGLREGAKNFANQIRFKYWGDRHRYYDITFHSFDIGRRSGAFSIFNNDQAKYEEFVTDLFKLLKAGGLTVFVNVTDLEVARGRNWTTSTVLDRSSDHIVSSFARYLLGCGGKGKITIESATDTQNSFFLKSFGHYLSPRAIPNIDFRDVQEAMTSISFVTKKNHDVEEQIADLFAYAAKCKYEKEEKGFAFAASSYEGRIIKILENKLFSTPANAAPAKAALYSGIESFKILTQ